MNINSNDIIAGLPALEARELMKKLSRFDYGFSAKEVAKHCNVTTQIAEQHIHQLVDEKYIEAKEVRNGEQRWVTSIKGNALSQASAAKRVKRATADKHYHLFLDRVIEINNNDQYMYQVSKVKLFGSYLSDSEMVGDIDMFVLIEIKAKFIEDFPRIRVRKTKEMKSEGRFFQSYDDECRWPQLDVRKYLKNRSRVISIQSCYAQNEHFDCKLVFDIDSELD